MVQQLFTEIKNMQDEVRRLRGRLDRLSIGGVIIAPSPGGTVPAAVDGAIIRGNADPNWERLAASVPAANVRNVLGLDNGDLRPSWKTALDATNPTTAAFGDAAAPGTSLVFSHRDHRHGMPASGGSAHVIEDEGTPLTARSKLNFVGAGVTATDDSGDDASVITIPGGSGHVIEDEGTPLTARTKLNFVGSGVAVTDDSGDDASVVTISSGGDVSSSGLQASFLQNEIMNFPSLEKADGTQPEWWEEDHANCTGTEEDLAGESLTARYNLRCHKVVITTAGPHWFYQRFTYADQPRVKSGETVSLIYAVWSVSGVSARVGLLTSAATSSYSTPTTSAAWNIHTVDALVLDGTYVDVVEEVNAVGTAYFIPLAFIVGGKAYPMGVRKIVLRWRDSVMAQDLAGKGDEATWTDVDVTSLTSPLAVMAIIAGRLTDNTSTDDFALYTRRNGSSEAPSLDLNALARAGGSTTTIGVHEQYNAQIILDDQQIFEYYLDRIAGSGTLLAGNIALRGWWEWE